MEQRNTVLGDALGIPRMSSRRKGLGAECTSKTRHDDLFVCGPTVNKLTLSYSRAPIGHNDARFLLLWTHPPTSSTAHTSAAAGAVPPAGSAVGAQRPAPSFAPPVLASFAPPRPPSFISVWSPCLCVCLSLSLCPFLLCACPPLSLSAFRILLLLSLLVMLF